MPQDFRPRTTRNPRKKNGTIRPGCENIRAFFCLRGMNWRKLEPLRYYLIFGFSPARAANVARSAAAKSG